LSAQENAPHAPAGEERVRKAAFARGTRVRKTVPPPQPQLLENAWSTTTSNLVKLEQASPPEEDGDAGSTSQPFLEEDEA